MKKITICFAIAIMCSKLVFISELSAQTLGFSQCLDQNDAFIGLDRKGWTSQESRLSESYQFDFELPDPSPLDCYAVSFINVSIDFSEALNNIPANCIGGFWTHALACDSNDPIDCPTSTILYDEQGLNTSFTLNEELENGQNLGIDIVVLTNVQDPTCNPSVISAGLFEADIDICIEVFYEPLEPEMNVDLGDDIIICPGETIDIDGPNGFESYEWDGPITSDEQTLEDAIPGIYILDAYDEFGCKSSDEIEILADNEINIDLGVPNPLSVCGGSDLNISATVNSIENNPDFEYEWILPDNSDINNSSLSVNQQGVYTLIVTDSETDCTSTIDLIVQETEISEAQIDSISLPLINICEGGSTNLNAFVPFEDLNNYAFEWIFGTDTTRTQMLSANQVGTYILNMYNQLGCPVSSDTVVVNQIVPLSAGQNDNTTICKDEEIDLNSLLSSDASANGQWLDDGNNEIVNGIFSSSLSNNTINITYVVANDLPCDDDTAFFTLFINDESVNAGNDMSLVVCSDDNFNLTEIQNGDQGGSFFNASFDEVFTTTIEASNLASGINTYYYIVSGGNCGQDTALLNLNILTEIAPTIIEGPFCISEEIAIGNETFNSTNTTGSVNLSSINSCDSIVEVDMMFFDVAESFVNDTYCSNESIMIAGQTFDVTNNSDVIIIDDASINGCDSIVNVNLNFVDAVESFFNQQLCEGESIMIGGQVFDETNTSDIITLTNGSILGCDSILNVDLTFTSVINENISEILCQDEEIEINGEIFNASNTTGEQNFTSVLGCDSLLIIEITILESSAQNITMDLCEGDEIQINGEIFNSSNLTSEQILINSVGCDSTITISINLISTSINNITNTLCEGESIIIDGEEYDIDNPNGIVTIENGSNLSCDSIINIDLQFIEQVDVTVANELCEGDSIFINGNWEITSGEFQEFSTSSQGCDSTTTFQVNFTNCNVEITTELMSEISCFGEGDAQVEISLSGELNFPYTYELLNLQTGGIEFTDQINSDNFILPDLAASDYTFNLYSQAGDIINSIDLNIIQPEELTILFTKDDVLCLGETTGNLSLQVAGGTQPYSYLWSNGSTEAFINELTAGTYSYTVTDMNGCDNQGSVSIIEPDNITANLIVTNSDCEDSSNGSIDVIDIEGGTPLYQFSIDGYNYSTSSEFDNLAVGPYAVFITDANGCLEEFNTSIAFESTNTIGQLNDLNITLGDSVSVALNLDFTPANITWLNSEFISCNDCLVANLFPNTTTTYNVEIEDESGCIVSQSFTVNVIIPDNNQVYVPTVFNPTDQSSGNNLFRPYFSPDANIDFISLEIYDRWGNLIYTESNVLVGWDGRSKNNRSINQGVYVYKVNYIDNNGNAQVIVGDITLLR